MAKDNIVRVLVVGAGIGGIKAALELAEMGFQVNLTESSPAIGGILSQLDYQFPDNHCGLCRMLPLWERDLGSDFCMRKALFHENVTISSMTELEAVAGEVGHFQVTLKRRSRGVDTKRCVGCRRCIEVCPVTVSDSFNEGLSKRKAVYQPVPHNLPYTYQVDFESCTQCGDCVSACPTDAIDLKEETRKETCEVGAIILAPGCGLFDPSQMVSYQYGILPDVVTGLELERMLSATGPTGGRLLRPSDGTAPKSICWVQCVGSRNKRLGRNYCSSICCMFALKEAVLIKERIPGAECVVFYMDMRTYGKDAYRYQSKAEDQGVELIRCRVHKVDTAPDGRLLVRYVDEAFRFIDRPFDLVVLSTGQTSTPEMLGLAGAAGVRLNEDGFAHGPGLSQAASPRPGIYWCGSFTGLRDISETVAQAQAAAMAVAEDLGRPGSSNEVKDHLPLRDVSREEPKVGLLLCRCFGHQDQDLPWEELKSELSGVPGLVEVLEADRLCQQEGVKRATQMLEDKDFNRAVIAACRPYVYDRQLRRLGRALGLSEDLVEVLDLRGVGLSLDRPHEKKTLARCMVTGALLRLRRQRVASPAILPVTSDLLVIGGGLAGMTAALRAARQGIPVWIVEKSSDLGGEVLKRRYTIEGLDPLALIENVKRKVQAEDGIKVLLNAETHGLEGEVGGFRALVRQEQGDHEISCGAVILATGGHEAKTGDYSYGKSGRIMLQGELERELHDKCPSPDELGHVVMIQCVGSRDETRPYCSRICCAAALKNALKIKEINPHATVYILYRDLMTYGFLEAYYAKAREQGILIFSYEPDNKPEVSVKGDELKVIFHDSILEEAVEMKADKVVLSTGVRPSDHAVLACRLGLELNGDGFFQEMDSKWRPVDLKRPGIFVCGLAHSPLNMAETLIQADAAAVRAVNLLGKKELKISQAVSAVKQTICSLCEICIDACPFVARRRDRDKIKVIAAACQGCGICVASCPNSAAWLPLSSERQTMGLLEGLLEGVG
jgi:heterodisulfide reductase subunit A